MTNPRQTISEILVKWDMPTRQAAINELVQLIEATVLEVIGKNGIYANNSHVGRKLAEQRARLAQLLGREKGN